MFIVQLNYYKLFIQSDLNPADYNLILSKRYMH